MMHRLQSGGGLPTSEQGGPGLRVGIVGAGIGGLAAAIQSAVSGHQVTVFDAAAQVGGKMRRVEVAPGVALDAGPTVLTMRETFDRLFAAAGQSLDDFVQLRKLERLARHAWTDGRELDLYADEARSYAEIAATFGAKEAEGYRRFTAHAKKIFARVDEPFIRASKPGLASALRAGGLRGLLGMLGVDWHRSMWRAIESFFEAPQLRQLFGRYATYYGSSPFAAPATLNLIAEVERAGVWTVEGGMHALARAMQKLATSLGVDFRLGEAVEQIQVEGGRVRGLSCARGSEDFDAVIFNGAAQALAAGRLGEPARAAFRSRREAPRSLSALTWCCHVEAQGFELDFHNVFFSDDYAAEFAALFGRGELPGQPTVYVCAQDRGPEAATPTGGPERIFVLANAPALGDRAQPTKRAIERCERATFELMQRCGLRLQGTPATAESTQRSDPRTFERLFPATGGALYGPATHGPFAAFGRPTARTRIGGLYLAGGTAHPGAGVPMVAQSGRMAVEAMDLDAAKLRRRRSLSMPKSPAVATAGGTSTPSIPAASGR